MLLQLQDLAESMLDLFAVAVARLLANPDEASAMGARGHTRVLQRYLAFGSLLRYGALIEWLDESFVERRAHRTA